MTALFHASDLPIPLDAQIACVEREIRLRERVYPNWIAHGRMTKAKADSEIATMRAVLDTLRGAKGA